MGKVLKQISTNRLAKAAYTVASVFAIAIFTIGFFVPPMGKIDGSVLIAGGSVMIFTLAVIAIYYNANIKLEFDLDDRKATISTQKDHRNEEY